MIAVKRKLCWCYDRAEEGWMALRLPSRGSDQFQLRLPDGMRDRLREAADANGRSMNAEIVARLQESFEGLAPSNVNPEMWELTKLAEEAIKDRKEAAAQHERQSREMRDMIDALERTIITILNEARPPGGKMIPMPNSSPLDDGADTAPSSPAPSPKSAPRTGFDPTRPIKRELDLSTKPAAEEPPAQPDKSHRALDLGPSTPTKRPARS